MIQTKTRMKMSYTSEKHGVALFLLAVYICIQLGQEVDGRCDKTENGKGYPLTIGLLSTEDSNFTIQRTIQENIRRAGEVEKCFQVPHYLNLQVQKTLMIKTDGWTMVKTGIRKALASQGVEEGIQPNLIIGPFYTNLAMVLEQMRIPYLVTDYKGFDWIDMSRVQDGTAWDTMVEIRPPAQEQNLAVVDLFRSRKWVTAVMVMPESAADNQECLDLAQQMIANSISLIPYTIDPTSPKAKSMTKEVLRSARLSWQKHIIVCSPRDSRDNLIEIVLKEAKPFDLLLDPQQVFVLVDPSSYLRPLAGASQMFKLGLFSARCSLLAFRYVQPRIDGKTEDANVATAFDAARVTVMALHSYISKQKEQANRFGPIRFLNHLKKVQLQDGRTGFIRFNKTGQRVNYTLHLYNHGGEEMYKKEAEWSLSGDTPHIRLNLTQPDSNSRKSIQYGIFPDLLKVVVVEEEPFIMLKNTSGTNIKYEGNDRFEGFTIDLLTKLSEKLNFKYEIYLSPKNGYGVEVENGRWDGMVGEILAGNASLAMGAISITSSRERVIDFSLGIISTGVNILIKKPDIEFTIFQFLKPFSLYLWMAIVGASLFVSLSFFLLDYTNSDRKFTVKEAMWYSVGTLLKRGTDFSPRPISQRILSAGFAFFVLITVSTYTANMAAFLTTKNLGKTINSFESLAEDSSIAVGTVRNSATMKFIQKERDYTWARLNMKMNLTDGLVDNSTEGRARVDKENYAFIFDYLINAYSEMKYCKTKAVSSPILMQEHGIGMEAGAPFKTSINIELLKLKEHGYLASLKKKWWDDKRLCDRSSKRAKGAQFGVYHTAGVFVLGAVGLGFSVTFFLFKKFYLINKQKNEDQKKEMDKEKDKELLCKGSPASV